MSVTKTSTFAYQPEAVLANGGAVVGRVILPIEILEAGRISAEFHEMREAMRLI